MNQVITDTQWQAVAQRRETRDFVFGVVTTGIACQPGCPSRLPRRENVRYFDNLAQALQQGFRPCKRCFAAAKYEALINVCRGLYETDQDLATLIAEQNVSARQLQRQFREFLGTTPKQFQLQVRFNRFVKAVQQGQAITHAIYDAGFGSTSRMYEQVGQRLGMNTSTYIAQGDQELIFYATQAHREQTLVFAQTLKGLCFSGFYDHTSCGITALKQEFPKAALIKVLPDQLEPIHSAMQQALRGDYRQLESIPLDIRGTAFQCQVWEAVRHVEPGLRVSYQTLARQLNKPKHSRAVAQALARNKIALAIPCHRVVPASGGEGGYRWGEDTKRDLLAQES